MQERLESIDQRLERVESRMERMVDLQAEMAADIREHMRRTAIAESNIDKLAETLAPVQKHVAAVQGVGIFLGVLAAAGTVAAVLIELLGS